MPAGAPGRAALPGLGVDGAALGMAAGDRRWRPLRYQSLAALVEDSQWPFLFLVSDFSYGADDYDGEGNEEQKGPPEGSETMPYIDESPTMSPQLSARNQGGGDSISPTPPEGLAPGVGTPAFPSGFGKRGLLGRGVGRHGCRGPRSAWSATGVQDSGNLGLLLVPSSSHSGPGPLRLAPAPHLLLSLPLLHLPLPLLPAICSPCLLDTSLPLSAFSLSSSLAGWDLVGGNRLSSLGPGWAVAAYVSCGL